jgi:hypothetical protein
MDGGWLGFVLTAIVAGLGSGVLVKSIDFFQNRHKNDAETEEIYSRVNSRTRRQMWVVEQHNELTRYKVDQMLLKFDELLNEVSHCPGVNVSKVRGEINEIKYLDRIPGREPPPPYGGSDEVMA